MPKEKLPLNDYRHFFLYAKHHYQKFTVDGSVWGDLKKIHSEWCDIDEEFISRSDIMFIVIKCVEKYIQPISLFDFIHSISPRECWKTWPGQNNIMISSEEMYDFYTAVIGKCLSLLRFTTVVDKDGNLIMNLGEPDPNILPVKEK